MEKESAALQAARRRLRAIQFRYGRLVTSQIAVQFGITWNRAIEQDPTGERANRLLDTLEITLKLEEERAKIQESGK